MQSTTRGMCSSYNITSILKAFLIINYQNLNSRDGAQIYPYMICGNSKRKRISQFHCAQVAAPLLLPPSPSVSLSLRRSLSKNTIVTNRTSAAMTWKLSGSVSTGAASVRSWKWGVLVSTGNAAAVAPLLRFWGERRSGKGVCNHIAGPGRYLRSEVNSAMVARGAAVWQTTVLKHRWVLSIDARRYT